MTRLTHIIGYSAETSAPNEKPRWGHFTARWADEAQKNFEEWLEEHDAELEEDQRITAWHQIAAHPFFAECFYSDDALIEAMLAKLDRYQNREMPDPVTAGEFMAALGEVSGESPAMHGLHLTPDPDGIVGNDGLTDKERAELAERARARKPSAEARQRLQARRLLRQAGVSVDDVDTAAESAVRLPSLDSVAQVSREAGLYDDDQF